MSSDARPAIAAEGTSEMPWLREVVARSANLVDLARAEGLIWGGDAPPTELLDLLDRHRNIRWIQLPWAGVEPYLPVIRANDARVWTCGKGAYARPVAELALALAIACLRRVPQYARARQWERLEAVGHLSGSRVVLVGGGGIATELVTLLAPFDLDITVVRRSGAHLPGADRVVGTSDLRCALIDAHVAIIALPSTPSTVGIIDREAMDLLGPTGVLVNVGRGSHVVTGDLVDALSAGTLGGAALDVTDPEPLPPEHRLWSLPTCIVTPHIANDDITTPPLLAARITENLRRFASGERLLGQVDPQAGY